MKITYDSTAQSGYIQVLDGVVEKTVPVSENVVCDLDDQGMLCGIEFLNITVEKLKDVAANFQKSEFILQ